MSNKQSTIPLKQVGTIRATNNGSPISQNTEEKLCFTLGQYRTTFFTDFFFDIKGDQDRALSFLELCCAMLNDRGYHDVVRLTRFKWQNGVKPTLHWLYISGAQTPTVSESVLQNIVAKAYDRVREPDDNALAKAADVSTNPLVRVAVGKVPAPTEVQPKSVVVIAPDARAMQIYDCTTVQRKLDEENQISSSDRRHGLVSLYERMLERGGMRTTKLPPRAHTIHTLADQFPNFAEVVELLSASAALSSLDKSAFHFPPLLLLGPPGIGKTYFATTLAGIAHVDHKVVSMETTSASWVLSGGHRGWSGASVGKVAETLVHAQVGNPIIVLDEVDKVSEGNYDPLAPLYRLLEQNTAAEFEDEFLSLPMDASRINWILTANDITRVPEPLVSRMTMVKVPAPSKIQIRKVVGQIYRDMRDANFWGTHFTDTLGEAAIDLLATLSPRQVRHRLLFAFGRAAEVGRAHIEVADFRMMLDGASDKADPALEFASTNTDPKSGGNLH